MSSTFASPWKRLAIAIGLVLVGMALIPYVALPSERFGWQIFAGIYGGDPELLINYPDGAPGSSFTITGVNYPANTTLGVIVNDTPIGTIDTDEIGAFMLRITTTSSSDWGSYVVTIAEAPAQVEQATGASAQTRFALARTAPLRAADNTVAVIGLPEEVSALNQLYIPMIYQEE